MRKWTKTLAVVGASVFAIFIGTGDAHAAILISQTNYSGTCIANGSGCAGEFTQIPATGAGTTESMQFYFTSANGAQPFQFQLSGSMGNECTVTGTTTGTTGFETFPCDPGSNFNAIATGDSQEGNFLAASSPGPTFGTNGLANGHGFNPYYIAFDSGGYAIAQTGFVPPYSPANQTVSTANPVSFGATFINTGAEGYDNFTIQLQDITDPTNIISTIPQAIPQASGTFSATSSYPLKLGDTYIWRPELFSIASSTAPLYGEWYTYYASSSIPFDYNTNFVGSTIGTSTLPSATNLLSFLNVPYLMETKVPFAFLFQTYNAIQIAINASSTTSVPQGNASVYGLGTSTNATTTFEIFGISSVREFLPDSTISSLRGFMLLVLYGTFVFGMYREAHRLKII